MTDYPLRDGADVVREFLALEGARALDVGCGDGALVRLMAREGATAIGLEISEDQLVRAKAAPPVGGESYQVGRAEALPFDDGAFDIVVIFNSLHHVPVEFQEKALAEAARVLKRDGALFVMEPLAEGAYFELVRAVDDETEVRAAAYEALRRAGKGEHFEEVREYTFATEYRYDSFEAFKDAVLKVDGSRRTAFESQEPRLREQFERTAERTDSGYRFNHPKRLNLLKRL